MSWTIGALYVRYSSLQNPITLGKENDLGLSAARRSLVPYKQTQASGHRKCIMLHLVSISTFALFTRTYWKHRHAFLRFSMAHDLG
jgi:hypothetical protein